MRNVLAVTTAAAALMWATAVSAQDAQIYVTQDASGNRMVMGGADPAGTVLLAPGGDVAPGDCPAGSYWIDTQQRVHACEGDEVFALQAPPAGALMPDGQPYPANTMLFVREGTQDAGGTGAPSGENDNVNANTDAQDPGAGGQQGGATGGQPGGAAGDQVGGAAGDQAGGAAGGQAGGAAGGQQGGAAGGQVGGAAGDQQGGAAGGQQGGGGAGQ